MKDVPDRPYRDPAFTANGSTFVDGELRIPKEGKLPRACLMCTTGKGVRRRAEKFAWRPLGFLGPFASVAHQVTCPCCGFKTRAAHDDKVIPPSPFGPRLMAIMAMVTGIYHVSRRSAVGLLFDLLGVRVSLGALSAVEARVGEAVQPVVDEAWDHVRSADVKHTDGTSWHQAGLSMALWTIATTASTVFKVVADSSKDTLRPLYGALKGILVSDRATSLTFWTMERRQICWAHLIRKFVSFSERDGPAGAFGRQLLDYAGVVFDYWHDYKAGKLRRDQLVAWMAPVKKQVRELLDKAVAAYSFTTCATSMPPLL